MLFRSAYTSGGSISGDKGSSKNKTNGFDLMGAYALGNHFAVIGSYHNRRERNYYLPYRSGPFDTSLVRYKRNEWEAGLGYFSTLNTMQTFTANFYAGIGNGTYKITDDGITKGNNYSRFHNAKPFKIFFQPSFNVILPELRLGFLCRVNVIKYGEVATNYTGDELTSLHLDNLNNKTLIFPEWGMNIEIRNHKWPWIKLEGQLSVNLNDDRYYRSRTLNASAGLVVEPFLLFQEKQ